MYFITDAFWGVFDTLRVPEFLYADTIIYYISMALTIAYLCSYVTLYLNLQTGFGQFIRLFGQAFTCLEMVLLVVNHFIHIFFWIRPDGTYEAYSYRYIALLMQVVLCVLLLAESGVAMIKSTGAMRKKCFTILLFCLTMSVAILFQVLYPLLPIYAIGLLIGNGIIHTFVNEGEKEDQFMVLQSMADIHYSMHVIDLAKDTLEEFSAGVDVKALVNDDKSGARELMRKVMKALITEEYTDAALEFTDLATLPERMRGKKTLAQQFIGVNTGWIQSMFIAIETDPYDKPTKVIYTTRVIEEEKKKVKVNKARLTFINAYQDYIFAVTGQKVTKEEVEDFKNNLNFLEKTLSKKPEDKNKYKYSFHYDSSKDDISKLDELEEIAKLWKHYFG